MSTGSDLGNTLAAQAGLLAELMSIAVEPHLERAGITPGLFEVLSAIHAAGQSSTQADIARRLRITPPSLCEAVAAAVKKGLVIQTPSSRDKRTKNLRLTVEGRKAIAKALQAVNQLERDMVQDLDSHELRTAIGVLKRTNMIVAKRLQADVNEN